MPPFAAYFVFSCYNTILLLYIFCIATIVFIILPGINQWGNPPYNSLLSDRSKHPFPPLDIF